VILPTTNTMNPPRNLNFKALALAIAGVLFLPGCASTGNAKSNTDARVQDYHVRSVQHGKASWYSVGTNSGTRTASGKRLTNEAATAAHKTLPLGTKVRVTNQNNGKSEIVTIIDRGPYVRGRIIDLTIGCAERLGFRHRGVAPVKVEVLGHLDTKN
jgi:rare lipoprotein A